MLILEWFKAHFSVTWQTQSAHLLLLYTDFKQYNILKCLEVLLSFQLSSHNCFLPSSAALAVVSLQHPQWWWGTGKGAPQSCWCLSCLSKRTFWQCTSPLLCTAPWGRAPQSPEQDRSGSVSKSFHHKSIKISQEILMLRRTMWGFISLH